MKEITFQFHITIHDLPKEKKEDFLSLCAREQVKPLLIVLPEGNYLKQPMFTKLIKSTNLETALPLAEQTAENFEKSGFSIARIKAEVFSQESNLFQSMKFKNFQPYYEWHCKVKIEKEEETEQLCKKYSAHLSANSLEEDGKTKYITIREYDSEVLFYEAVERFHQILSEKKIVTILKQKFEYCIYDSRLELDKGWAS